MLATSGVSCHPDRVISNCEHCTENAGKPHAPCKDRCPCQHGKPHEMSPIEGQGFAGYLNGLPADHPERKAYEERTGIRLSPV